MGMWGDLLTGKSISHPSVFERYTEASRRAIDFAWQETLHRGGTAITVADFLAGLSTEENTRAERIGSLKANASYLRWLVGSPALPSQIWGSDTGAGADDDLDAEEGVQTNRARSRVELDAESKRAIAFAVVEADRDRNYWIDSDHLLRGLMRFPNKAHFAVLKTEINLKSVRVASRVDRERFLPEETPSLKVVQYLVRKHVALWVPPILSLACYLYILIQSAGIEFSPLAR